MTFILSLDGDTDLTVGGGTTQMAATTAVTNGTGTIVDIIATQLVFTTQPAPLTSTSGALLDFTTDPAITARDVNGLKDTDFTDTVTLTETGAGTATYANNSVAAVSGVATFTNLTVTYTATADQETYGLQADDTAGGTEGDITTLPTSSLITADVVATQMVFTTQPAPLTATSGVALDFTTDPVIEARDAAGTKDTGFTDTVTLTETGAGTATYTNNSLAATSGVATFTGLTVTYTGTVDGESFALQADDTAGGSEGDLSTVNSSSLTASFDSDAGLSAGSGVSEPVALPSTANSTGTAVNVFDFNLTDGGGGDSKPLNASQVVVHTSGTGPFAKVTWRLNGPDASNVTGTYSSGANTLTFSGLSLSVADGGSETYTVNAYYNDNTSLTENQTLILSVDGDTDITVTNTGTQMATTSAVNNSTGSTVAITATQLVFATSPAGSVSGAALTTQPVVEARDAAGNVDLGFVDTVTLTEGSAGSLANNSVTAASGVATFATLTYTATADQQAFTLTADDVAGGSEGDLPTVNAGAVTADVVATQLVITTQPAPLTSTSGSALDFSTDPVVEARDANGVKDTGFSDTVTLTETGSGTATYTNNSVAATSGVATFTNLTVTYTATADGQTFALQADDTAGGSEGDLTTLPTSSNLTSDVVATQMVITTQPAPLTSTSGSALDFSTDPVVEARDANGVKDTGFTDTVTLTETGSGTATYTNNDDLDKRRPTDFASISG